MLSKSFQRLQASALPRFSAQLSARFVSHGQPPEKFLPLPTPSAHFEQAPRWFYPDFTPEMHLNDEGHIHGWILSYRWNWFEERGILRNPFMLDGLQYYENRHLFSPTDTNSDGEYNVNRMCSGFAPICPYGSPMVIHHFDQRQDGARILIPDWVHRRYDALMHSKIEVANGVDRASFARERRTLWEHLGVKHLKAHPEDIVLLSEQVQKRLKLS